MSSKPAAMDRLELSQTNRPVHVILYWHSNADRGLLLDPPYQRGDVWGDKRRRNLIYSLLRRIPIPSIVINDRGAAGWKGDDRIAVIDGKQRATAILRFVDDRLQVPGEWFGVDKPMIVFSDLSEGLRRLFLQRGMPFTEGHLATLEDEQMVFDLVNFGGLAQGETDEQEGESA